MLLSAARLLDGSALATPAAIAAFQAHAIAAYPEECIGILDAAGEYRPLENTSPYPKVHATVAPGVIVEIDEAGDLRAILHSHPSDLDCPSEADMVSQIEWEVPFAICTSNGQAATEPFAWGDQLLDDSPLVGRQFRHGVHDCYSLVRAFYRETAGVLLPDYPRNWEWWQSSTEGSKDLYLRYFREAGFEEISPEDVRPGDAWLAAIRSETPNHAGVVLDDGLCLHHVSGGRAYDPIRLSKREPLARLFDYVTHWVRRKEV